MKAKTKPQPARTKRGPRPPSARRPLAKTPRGANAPAAGFRHLLVPVDFSVSGAGALAHAARLARPENARITLLHVLETPAYPAEFGYPIPTEQTQLAALKTRLEVLAARALPAPLTVKVLLRVGAPGREIVTAARRLRADLIVLTTHGRTGLARVLLGSTAERVVRHAPCAVLVVRRVAN